MHLITRKIPLEKLEFYGIKGVAHEIMARPIVWIMIH